MKRAALLLAVAWIALEIAALVWVVAVGEEGPSGAEPPGESLDRRDSEANDVIHPYLGYVHDPTRMPAVGSHGFVALGEPVARRSVDRWRVALLGGSAAEELARSAADELRQALARSAQTDREIELVNLSCAGYRQPQPLLTLNWLLTLGAEFDAVILIDGADELAFRSASASSAPIFPVYPRNWGRLASFTTDLTLARALAERSWLQAEINGLRDRGMRFWPLRNLVLQLRLGRLGRRLIEVDATVAGIETGAARYRVTGPRMRSDEPREALALMTQVWERSSRQLAGLCEQNGMPFFHFLHPDPQPPGDALAELGREVLIRRGRQLLQAGVAFHDLSAFEGESVGRSAVQALAEEIGLQVGAALQSREHGTAQYQSGHDPSGNRRQVETGPAHRGDDPPGQASRRSSSGQQRTEGGQGDDDRADCRLHAPGAVGFARQHDVAMLPVSHPRGTTAAIEAEVAERQEREAAQRKTDQPTAP